MPMVCEVITCFLNSQSHLQLNSVASSELHTKRQGGQGGGGGRGLSRSKNTVLVIMKVFSLQIKAKEAILLTFITISITYSIICYN